MNERSTLLIRADAGGRLGTGHVMRMLALAQAWQDRGHEVVIASACCPGGVVERLEEAGFGHQLLDACEPGEGSDARQTIGMAQNLGCEWVVLDGYHFGSRFQRALREAGPKVLCVDDYGHCESWACEAVLNQNLGAERESRISEVEPFVRLLGAKFALLRREFYGGNPVALRSRAIPLCRILVTLGGVDQDNATGSVLALLEHAKVDPLDIRVLAGAGNPHIEKHRSHTSRHGIEILVNVADMPAQYEWADGIISAGGSTCWEWLYYGLPACVVTVAENQVPVVEEIRNQGLAVALGWLDQLDPAQSSLLLEQWIAAKRTESLAEAKRPVDGWGAHRVAAFLAGSPVLIREAGASDLMTYYRWANDPVVRDNAFHPEEIPLEDHENWFQRRLDSPETRLLLGETLAGEPMGQVRFERFDDGRWLLGYSVASEFRGKGMGVALLRESLLTFGRYHPDSRVAILAEVKPDNQASIKTLERAGFVAMNSGGLNARSAVELTVLTGSNVAPRI